MSQNHSKIERQPSRLSIIKNSSGRKVRKVDKQTIESLTSLTMTENLLRYHLGSGHVVEIF